MIADDDPDLKRDERRLSDRSRLIVDVFFDGEDATGVASTKDISVGGFYMNTSADLPEGAMLTVRISFGQGREVVSSARVAYLNAGLGVGVKFLDLTPEAHAILEHELKHG